jgi:molybdopterin-containing oxidoreductase family membrane subunit
MINIGMWMERYIVIIPTEISPRLLTVMGQGQYLPTFTEWSLTAACFAGLFLLYFVFTRYFPIIPVWETAEDLEEILPESLAEPAQA